MRFAALKIAIASSALIIFSFLLGKSLTIDVLQHDRFNSDLRQLKEIDATLNKEVFELRYGLILYYDPLVNNFKKIKNLQKRLKQIPSFIDDEKGQPEIEKFLEAYTSVQNQKESLIEQFKSQNAVLKNSLYYFPLLMTEMAQKAALQDSELADTLNNLLQDVLVYNLTASEDLAPKINSHIEKLLNKRKRYEQAVSRADLDIAIAHARVILKNKPSVDILLKNMVTLPTWQRNEELYKTYNRHYEKSFNTANIYRLFLFLFSIILVSGIATYIILKLRRSALEVSVAKEKVQEALEATQQAEEKYRSIFENSTEGIFQTTIGGQFVSANSSLARIYGYSSTEELIRCVTDIRKQIYVDWYRRAEFIDAMYKRDAVSQFESRCYRKDGSVIWISENARTVKDGRGKLLYYEGTVSDITERKLTQEALSVEQEKAERLLLNILPEAIAQRLKQETGSIADYFEEATVMFADIVGFTQLASRSSPSELVALLNQIFSTFDQLAEKHGLEKIKTIGDAYMVAGGLPMPRANHVEAIAEMALDMQREIRRLCVETGEPLSIRIGINTGPVVAGVIGLKKFIYDLWGDTVNVASRMESQGMTGCIQVTASTYKRLRHKYSFVNRGTIEVKGKGKMRTYLLTERKSD